MLKEGTNAPAFKTTDQNGETVSLKDLRGQKVVLYFYPKDDTPGCTKEACSFRDAFSKIFLILPFSSMRKVVRCTPMYVRPMNFFSPQTPYASAIE